MLISGRADEADDEEEEEEEEASFPKHSAPPQQGSIWQAGTGAATRDAMVGVDAWGMDMEGHTGHTGQVGHQGPGAPHSYASGHSNPAFKKQQGQQQRLQKRRRRGGVDVADLRANTEYSGGLARAIASLAPAATLSAWSQSAHGGVFRRCSFHARHFTHGCCVAVAG
jgi:hypothetical protein